MEGGEFGFGHAGIHGGIGGIEVGITLGLHGLVDGGAAQSPLVEQLRQLGGNGIGHGNFEGDFVEATVVVGKILERGRLLVDGHDNLGLARLETLEPGTALLHNRGIGGFELDGNARMAGQVFHHGLGEGLDEHVVLRPDGDNDVVGNQLRGLLLRTHRETSRGKQTQRE